ncbi:MAG: MarR family transcriptional regulator [Lachnospiraceae bacterium]|nr:MarR family transcriptional regulator [Lachnospiraceae bacterium]MDE7334542.1 MarR family transcriptional regulator [Lachnospiraceae bacterium]
MHKKVMDLFRQTDQTLKRVISKKVENTGLYRSQHRLLMYLGRHPDCSQTALAEKMDISPAAVAVSMKKLEKAGYIRRKCNAEDNRINHVVITDKGKEAINNSFVYFQEIEDALFDGFTAEETRQLEDFCRRIIQNGDEYYRGLTSREQNR